MSSWRPPLEMLTYVNAATVQLECDEIFVQSGLTALREGWVIAKFGSATGAEAVRLIPDEWPDAEVRASTMITRFEIVEADIPGRQRGREYQNRQCTEIEWDPVENWVARAEQIPGAVKEAVEKKLKKHYGETASLLIFVNIGEYGIRQKQVEACFSPATAAAHAAFETVWVLWKDKAYLASPPQQPTNDR